MALTDYYIQTFNLMTCTKTDDGEGGDREVWEEGAEFDAIISRDTTAPVISAEASRLYNTYSVIPKKSMTLPFKGVIKSQKDGKTYRILSDYIETPEISTLNMRQYKAERWDTE